MIVDFQPAVETHLANTYLTSYLFRNLLLFVRDSLYSATRRLGDPATIAVSSSASVMHFIRAPLLRAVLRNGFEAALDDGIDLSCLVEYFLLVAYERDAHIGQLLRC